MRVASVTYRRNRQLAPFVMEHIELEVIVEPEESPGEALRRAQSFVRRAWGEAPLTESEERRAAALEL